MMRGAARLNVREVAGSLGDLATFLPLAVGLITVNGVNATSLFLSAGLLYIAAGLYYGLPIPVQPLKATAAIAIATSVPAEAISAAALWAGLLFVAVSLFRLDEWLRKVFTRPVVRGIQLGLAVLLVRSGLNSVLLPSCASRSLAGVPVWAPGLAIAAVVAAIVALSRGSRRYPATLVVIPFGLLAGGFLMPAWLPRTVATGWVRPAVGLPLGVDPWSVFVALLLPQIPLTLANSIAATSDAARAYYGDRAKRVTHRGLAASLGIGNIVAGLVGGMPMCHGSGGVTAHYRFGARTGGAPLFIGTAFLVVGLFFGKSVADLSRLLPSSVLGALLVYVGVQHARLLGDIAGVPRELGVALAIGLATLATGNLAAAFAAGIALERAAGRFFPEASARAGAVGADDRTKPRPKPETP